MHLSKKTAAWLEDQLNGTIKTSQPLSGGTSSALWLITLNQNKKTKTVVLREYTDKEWLALEPGIAEQEASNLRAAEMLPLATPELLASDPYAQAAPHPTLVMSQVEGDVVLKPNNHFNWLDALAKTLATLHKNTVQVPHQYFRYADPSEEIRADWSSHPNLWRKAFRFLKDFPQPDYEPTFIHRDFHPANVLFKGKDVSAVIDWPNACMGPREYDVAHCRWNLAMLDGQAAADTFLKAYLKHSGLTHYDPYWDLEASLNVFSEDAPEVYGGWEAFGRKDLTPELMRQRMDAFLRQAGNTL